MAEDESLTVTVTETARLLRIGRNETYAAIERGEIPAIRIGRRILVPRAQLERLLGADDRQPDAAA